MEGVNSFEKGLHRSNSPQMQPEGSYVDALNWIRNDSGRLINEELEEITQTLTNGKYTFLGSCPTQDSFICFFKQEVGNNSYSEIGIFDNLTKQYTTVFNDSFTNPSYRLNFTNSIDSTARINSYSETIVYFVEEDNPVRRFNVTAFLNESNPYSSPLYNSLEDWNLQLTFKMPYAEYSLEGGGNLPSGTYSIALRYVTGENNRTTFNIPSRFINIPGKINIDSSTNLPKYNDETLGGEPQTNSGLSLKIKLKNVDDNYPLVEVVVITYIGLTNTISIRSLGTYENILNKEIIFSDDTQYVGDQIAERDLLESPVFINSAKCIEQKDNILVISNINTKRYDVGFQEIANQIELNWSVDKIPVDNRRNFQNVGYTRYGFSPPSSFKVVSDDITIIKTPPPNASSIRYNSSNTILPILTNESVTFPGAISGYAGITFTNGGCDVYVYYKGSLITYGAPGSTGTYFTISSQTSTGVTVAQGSGSGYKYTVPAPSAMSADAATTTLIINVLEAPVFNAPSTVVGTITRTINYKLSRPFQSGGTAPTVSIAYPSQGLPLTFVEDFLFPSIVSPANITLTATATTATIAAATSLSYQWKKDNINITGATGATYQIPSSHFVITNSVVYSCEVTYSLSTNSSNILLDSVNIGITGSIISGEGNRRYGDLSRDGYYKDINELNSSQSNVYADPFVLKGFQRGEVYSFSISPVYNDGSIGFAYHIPGKVADNLKPNRLKQWSSTEEYSSIYTSAGLTGKIKHHQMPDYDETGYIGDAHYINVLRVTATNINFTAEQLKNIQGFVIGYQPRVDDLTRRVIDTGFVKPYLYKSSGATYKYTVGLLDGTVEFNSEALGEGGGWFPAHDKPYSMFYSADTLLSKISNIKPNYNIQKIGLISNQILTPDPQEGKDVSIFFNPPVNGQPDYRPLRYTFHNKSFCDVSSVYAGHIISKFPFLIRKNNTQVDGYQYVSFFLELNNFTFDKQTGTEIENLYYIDDVLTPNGVGITNFPLSIISEHGNSKYVHLETTNSYFNSIPKLLVTQTISPNNSNNTLWYHTYDATGTGNDSKNAGDPRFRFVRITNDTSVQYGKLENATYTPCAVRYNDETLNNSITLEGDTYISKIFQRIMNHVHGWDTGGESSLAISSIVGYYSESKNNYSLRHQEINTTEFFPKEKSISSAEGILGILNIPFNKGSEILSYNKQYSAIANLRSTFPKPLLYRDNFEFANRSVYSRQSFESELIDQYRIFPSTNFHDVPKHRGTITDTFVFSNNFFHHTEYGLWLSYFNPNTTQATSQGQVVLGNAGVFQLPSKLILDIKGGYMGTMDKSGTNTPFGRVFLDHKQGKVFLFSGEAPVEISDLGLFSFFRGFVNTTDKYCMGYDWANKRLLINNITQGKAISYYPKTQTWTSFHTFSPQAYFTTNGYSYAFGESFNRGTGIVGTFYNMDNSQGMRKGSYITYVENTAPDSFKRFDRIEINTMSGGNEGVNSPGFVEPNSYVFNDKSFTHIHAWTDRQNTTELPFSYSHDFDSNFLSNYEVNKVPVNYYRSSFHAELPLDAVVDPSKNIFDASNTDINADFRAHMKGKFLYTKLSYNDDKPLVLNYVKTFFKPSVA